MESTGGADSGVVLMYRADLFAVPAKVQPLERELHPVRQCDYGT